MATSSPAGAPAQASASLHREPVDVLSRWVAFGEPILEDHRRMLQSPAEVRLARPDGRMPAVSHRLDRRHARDVGRSLTRSAAQTAVVQKISEDASTPTTAWPGVTEPAAASCRRRRVGSAPILEKEHQESLRQSLAICRKCVYPGYLGTQLTSAKEPRLRSIVKPISKPWSTSLTST